MEKEITNLALADAKLDRRHKRTGPNAEMIKVIPINLHRSPVVTSLLFATEAEKNADILIVSEQARGPADVIRGASCSENNLYYSDVVRKYLH